MGIEYEGEKEMRKVLISLFFIPCYLFSERFEFSSYTFDPELNKLHVVIDDNNTSKRYFYRLEGDRIWDKDPNDIMDFIIWNVPYFQDLIEDDCAREFIYER